MIKPISSNISKMGIDPIKVPKNNSVSFAGLKISEATKEIPNFFKKVKVFL